MDFRLIPTAMTLNDLVDVLAVMLRNTLKVRDFKANCVKLVCDKNVAPII